MPHHSSRGSGILCRFLIVLACVVAMGLTGSGQGNVTAVGASVSYAYKAHSDITVGSLVSLDAGPEKFITLANSNNAPKLVGIAVAGDDSLLAVNAQTGLAQVAVSGSAAALVTTVNGEIKVGDQIAVSPFSGVGMKALPGSRIIGLAQTALKSNDKNSTKREVKDKQGKLQTIEVGFVQVSVAIGTAASAPQTNQTDSVAGFVKFVTGHEVSKTRVIFSGIIIIVTVIALVTLIYSSIYGTILAVGRNPLARASIYRTLRSVLIMSFLMALTAGFAVYLIVR
jgi:hypothetical protein